MKENLRAWAASPGPAPLPAELQKPDSLALAVLIEVITEDQMQHVAGGPRISND